MKKTLLYNANEIKRATKKDVWGCANIPVFSVGTIHEFNQLIGYVKYINASNGTVLYRGQPKDYGTLKPSGSRGQGCVSNDIVSALAEDRDFQHYLGLDNAEVSGWKKYQEVIISAVLQHYGAKTNCMDFVDNHWCALWFGLHRFNPSARSYSRRDDNDGLLYIYLYLADTNCPSIHGLYIGEDTYTVDLRKALPSYFLRPASQHGWVVCGRDAEKSSDYSENVLCVLEIKVSDANAWLGDGKLLTADNFFPDYDIDDGYKILLTKQKRSGVYKDNSRLILPVDEVKNYHLKKSFYHPEKQECEVLPNKECLIGDSRIENITSLYKVLLDKGWTEETCFDADWDECNPCVGQSPVTAMLVQEIFGGEIFRYTWKKRVHYFNRINGEAYDLTSQERGDHPFTDYDKDQSTEIGISKKSGVILREKKRVLMENADIIVKEVVNTCDNQR